MKVIAVNGSSSKNWNTATLLQKALEGAKSVGADTELVHLYDLNYKGCTSCFACKRKGSKFIGHCVMKDDLTSVLERIIECAVLLLLGSPIYFGNVTGEMRSLNLPEEYKKQLNYDELFQNNKNLLQLLNGPSEFLASYDTYQFDDYSINRNRPEINPIGLSGSIV